MRNRLRFILASSLATTGLLITPTVFAAGSGYTTPSPSSSSVPGGYTQVLTSQTISASPKTITAVAAGSSASFAFPAGAFSSPTTVSVTAPNLSGINSNLAHMGLSSYSAISGFGISFSNSVGGAVTPQVPIRATIHNSALRAGDILIKITGPTSSVRIPATFSAGQATFTFQKDPNFAILKPSSTVPGATSPTTGFPAISWSGAGVALIGTAIWLLRKPRRPHSV